MVLARFAPSPTGPLHLGGLRMALYNHLFARRNQGKWILRMEDTDQSRYVPGSTEGIQKSLEWAGLDYDYGPGRVGPHGPYFQSERLDLYKHYANRLIESGHAYRCFCSPDTLAGVKEKLARSGSSASYDRKCLHLTEEEVARKVRAGEKHTVRFNTTSSPSRPPAFDIIFRNLRDAHASLATDPILLKSDLYPTYHLASVVDDHEMEITHVLRGEEWITSLPLHLDLYAALNVDPPTFGHFPILLNPDGSKMSKRHGDIQVENFIKHGWEPEAVLNWLVLCGYGIHHETPADAGVKPPNNSSKQLESNQIMDLNEMVELFDITAVTQRNTILEPKILHYINKHHLMRKMKDEQELLNLAKRVEKQVSERFLNSPYVTTETVKRVIALLEGRLTNIHDLPDLATYLFEEPAKGDSLGNEGQDVYDNVLRHAAQSIENLMSNQQWQNEDFVIAMRKIGDEIGVVKPKLVLKILRQALTGMKDGPPLADVVRLIGKERALKRLECPSQPRASNI